MTTDQVLQELKRRGIEPALLSGRPVLTGKTGRASATLLAVVRWHREEIVRRLQASQPSREGQS